MQELPVCQCWRPSDAHSRSLLTVMVVMVRIVAQRGSNMRSTFREEANLLYSTYQGQLPRERAIRAIHRAVDDLGVKEILVKILISNAQSRKVKSDKISKLQEEQPAGQMQDLQQGKHQQQAQQQQAQQQLDRSQRPSSGVVLIQEGQFTETLRELAGDRYFSRPASQDHFILPSLPSPSPSVPFQQSLPRPPTPSASSDLRSLHLKQRCACPVGPGSFDKQEQVHLRQQFMDMVHSSKYDAMDTWRWRGQDGKEPKTLWGAASIGPDALSQAGSMPLTRTHMHRFFGAGGEKASSR